MKKLKKESKRNILRRIFSKICLLFFSCLKFFLLFRVLLRHLYFQALIYIR